ncbi:hypothetical protein AMATHDRAFT_61004 [Amanita thiersii Skay4041]|uniref:Uncharacterized protein n=1 Tax=Amanita thiersii Skay4041 TaxID=703135 RepID=A0A2A9NIP5_9AGAR|nr:hypothetical protein AMATHDRAFT_61004 [Amanita thiersii Skay4041]
MVENALKALFTLGLPLLAFGRPGGAAAGSSELSFHVLSGGNDNYFFRDNTTSAQLLLTAVNNTEALQRLVVALPAGNSGALTYFLPLNNEGSLSVTLVDGSFKSTTDAFNNVGAQADLSFTGNATLGVTVIGAVRAMRDYVEGAGTMHEIFNYTLNEFNDTSVRLHRQAINATADPTTGEMLFKGADLYLSVPSGSDAQLSVTPSNNGTFTPPTINILVPSAATSPIIRARVVTNETSPVGFNTQDLFLEVSQGSTPGIQTALHGLSDGTNEAANQVSFMTYTDKFTAGGWRFLTYFGRDSLIALRLLMPLMTPDAIEAALGAVIERANSTGALCHEETVGDYASFININNGRPDLGNAPFFDYKPYLFLLPAVSHYFLELPQGKGRSAAFLARNATLQEGTYSEILNRISNYNLGRAIPFFRQQVFTNLLAFRPGQPVGNWRDSNQGTGFGPIPFDVNSALVPASLRAAQNLIEAGILEQANVTGETDVDIGNVATVWENDAHKMFEVTISKKDAKARLKDYVQKAGLSEAMLDKNPPGIKYYALSLTEDGKAVEVMNSDTGFNLLYGANVSRDFLQLVVNTLTPYPQGLLTNIGMIVANPAYDSNRTNIEVFDRTEYHGTVIWSFQQALMAGGLARQLSFCAANVTITVDVNPPPSVKPDWCSDARFVQAVTEAQKRLWDSVRGAESQIHSEVWSYSFDNSTNRFSVADLARLSPTGVESDAIQLWSYGFLGLLDPSGHTIG